MKTRLRKRGKKHAYIPDTQLKPTSDITHIIAAGHYLQDKKPDVVVLAGDWWDMDSLNSYDTPGQYEWEAKDVKDDIECGWYALEVFIHALRGTEKGYKPRIVLTEGNHEHRITRAVESPENRRFKGWLTLEKSKFKLLGVEFKRFLEIATIDGIMYSHYFVNPQSLTSSAIGGTIENKLKNLGHSFCMGHQQHKQTGCIYAANGDRRIGLVCGRFYQEDQDYLGPQKNMQSWSGIFIMHEVNRGDYDLMEVSMNYLMREWK